MENLFPIGEESLTVSSTIWNKSYMATHHFINMVLEVLTRQPGKRNTQKAPKQDYIIPVQRYHDLSIGKANKSIKEANKGAK